MTTDVCACRDCWNVVDTDEGGLCIECQEAGCIPESGECLREQWAEAMEME